MINYGLIIKMLKLDISQLYALKIVFGNNFLKATSIKFFNSRLKFVNLHYEKKKHLDSMTLILR
jgi:hypothetical protein